MLSVRTRTILAYTALALSILVILERIAATIWWEQAFRFEDVLPACVVVIICVVLLRQLREQAAGSGSGEPSR